MLTSSSLRENNPKTLQSRTVDFHIIITQENPY